MSEGQTGNGPGISEARRPAGTVPVLVAAIAIALAGAAAIRAAIQQSRADEAAVGAADSERVNTASPGDVSPGSVSPTDATSAKREVGRTTELAQADPASDSEEKGADTKKADEKDSDEKDAEKTPGGETVEYPFNNRIPVPENIFDGGVGWLNSSGDIRLKDLRGKIVILDFWTYCCINCMHVLPDLEFIEKKYPNEVVVIGVHSAKFDNEKETENIRRAVQRYNIEHPVVNDADMAIWQKFGIRAWPSLLIIDAEGKACFLTSGEGKQELLDAVVGALIKYHKSTGTLDETPLRFDLEREKMPPRPLKFPGKVLADEAGGRLFVADTNHNRIVVCSLDGKLQEVIGSGAIGAKDGSYEAASFDHPQGMALVGDTLYVADTENHLLRTVDLKEKTVSTLAGTGEQDRQRTPGGPLLKTPLNSPWDVLALNGTLFVAMAGPHQIWSHKLGSETIEPYAGSGREDVLNGTLEDSAFAQPSGLATDGTRLYVCDSEGSAIRSVPTDGKGTVTTVAGTSDLFGGRSLFEFGDVDGKGGDARFQHPIGIAIEGDVLYVTDSYNHKIRKVTLKDGVGEVETWLGTGKPGMELDPPQFNEPHGAAIAAGKLYIADTNNHRICVADLKTGATTVLEIAGLEPPKSTRAESKDLAAGKPVTEVAPQKIRPGKALSFEVSFKLPEGYKLNQQGTVTAKLTAAGEQAVVAEDQLGKRIKADVEGETGTLSIPLAGPSGKGTFELALSFTYCRDGSGGVCKLATSKWKIPVEVIEGGAETPIRLEAAAE